MKGIERAKEIIEEYIRRPILVYFDPDVDGLLSGYLACTFLDSRNVKYSYYVNQKRRHGFDIQPSTLRGYLVIAVDFNISEPLMQSLVDNDVAIVSIDHHDIQDTLIDVVGKTGTKGVVLNNQYPFEPEEDRYLSGAGVVYEVLSTLYPDFKSKEREAIVGITLLSDARPIENVKARKYLKTTYSADTQQGYIGYLVDNTIDSDYGFGVPKMDRNFIDFTFSPKVNSLLRFGRESEALNFILGKGLTGGSTKSSQRELLSIMRKRASILDLPSVKIVACNVDDFLDISNVDISSFIGLLCSDIKGNGKSALAFVLDNGRVTRASFRGRYDDIHYRLGFQNLGIDAQGHPPAFGINNFEPTQDTWVQINDLIVELEDEHEISAKIVESTNLTFVMTTRGMDIATENCYVRDMFRTYIKYTGKNFRLTRKSHKMLPKLDASGNIVYNSKGKIEYEEGEIKFVEYMVDGRAVKGFDGNITPENGLILPILDKGYIKLYLREELN